MHMVGVGVHMWARLWLWLDCQGSYRSTCQKPRGYSVSGGAKRRAQRLSRV